MNFKKSKQKLFCNYDILKVFGEKNVLFINCLFSTVFQNLNDFTFI